MEKLKTIKSPHKVFEVVHHSILSDPKLAHLLLPSLLVLALSYADLKTVEKFAQHLSSMIREKLLLNSHYFLFELGPQVGELLCFLFDFLVDFEKNRREAHRFMIQRLVLRNRVCRIDAEYSAVFTLLRFINAFDMAKLACASGSHHKALFYIECVISQMREEGVTQVAMRSFKEENLNFIMRIFSEMGDRESVKGCRLLSRTLVPTTEDLLSSAFVENNSLETLMISAQLMRNK